jgi:hypothetical protein
VVVGEDEVADDEVVGVLDAEVGGRPRAADDVDLGLADGWVEGADASLEPLQQAAHGLVLGLHILGEPLDVAVGARRGALGYDLVRVASRDSGEAVPELLLVLWLVSIFFGLPTA